MKKNKRADLTYVNYVAMSQRVGNPLQENNQVKMDAKIKQKLIALGADLNKDGKLTQKELNTATRSRYVNNDYQEPIITSLDLSNLGVTSVEGIQYLSGLKKLNLSHNKISDLTPLSKLMNLSNLNLSYNNITNISKLPYYSTIYCYEEGKIVNLSHNNIILIFPDVYKFLTMDLHDVNSVYISTHMYLHQNNCLFGISIVLIHYMPDHSIPDIF